MTKIVSLILVLFFATSCAWHKEKKEDRRIEESVAQYKKQLAQSTVVVYNTEHPASQEIARHYMEMRGIPEYNLLSVSLPYTSAITRSNYIDQIEQPIVNQLIQKELLGYQQTPTNYIVTNYSIRFMVLCKGLPFIIKDPILSAGAAVDNELACITLRQKYERRIGSLKNPAYYAEKVSQINPANGVIMTARLDAPSDNLAYQLVDKAIEGEKRGFWGNNYVDARGITDPPYSIGDEWLLRSYQCLTNAGYECVLDTQEATFGKDFKMPSTIFYAGWYSYHANGPFKASNTQFTPGAIAYHLHSYSGKNIYSTTDHWVGPLINLGATCTFGYVDEPYLDGTSNVGMFTEWILKGASVGEAVYHSLPSISWQTTLVGDPLYTPLIPHSKRQVNEAIKEYPEILEWMRKKK